MDKKKKAFLSFHILPALLIIGLKLREECHFKYQEFTFWENMFSDTSIGESSTQTKCPRQGMMPYQEQWYILQKYKYHKKISKNADIVKWCKQCSKIENWICRGKTTRIQFLFLFLFFYKVNFIVDTWDFHRVWRNDRGVFGHYFSEVFFFILQVE